VAVATVSAADGTPHGLTVSSFTPISLDPPLILIAIDYAVLALPHLRAGNYFAINILDENQRDLSVRFAEQPEGRFDGIPWRPGPTGPPLLTGVLATLECRQWNTVEAGDHMVLFGEVVQASFREGKPLIHYLRDYHRLQ
jgi:flavin reductase (DIM6/NTAB) family NADH-FMN oxidoreductase RutF